MCPCVNPKSPWIPPYSILICHSFTKWLVFTSPQCQGSLPWDFLWIVTFSGYNSKLALIKCFLLSTSNQHISKRCVISLKSAGPARSDRNINSIQKGWPYILQLSFQWETFPTFTVDFLFHAITMLHTGITELLHTMLLLWLPHIWCQWCSRLIWYSVWCQISRLHLQSSLCQTIKELI